MEPSIGTALAHNTVGMPFNVFIRAFVSFSFDGEIPSTSVTDKIKYLYDR